MKFHHIGFACHNLDIETQNLALLGYSPEGEDFNDPLQGVRGRFLTAQGSPRLELLVQHGETQVLEPWLARGIKMYHLAYSVSNLKTEIEKFRQKRGKIMVPPTPAVAFGGREISFILLPTMMLIELIEL
jgi:methylmalonyl-CoA/ethylmalonyl-CoA epimerase